MTWGSYIKAVCKIGQREACCRYIVGDANGLQCGKLDAKLKMQIDERVAVGLFTAIADNCDGFPVTEDLGAKELA